MYHVSCIIKNITNDQIVSMVYAKELGKFLAFWKCLSTTFDANHLEFTKVKCQFFPPKWRVNISSTTPRLTNG